MKYLRFQQKRKMLKVSSNNITFNKNQTIKSLTLQNQYPNNIIFKIKVSAVGCLSIKPSKGFIKANSSVSFIIKSLKGQKFQVKVLFTYGFILGNYHSFNQEWNKIKENNQFQRQIIHVKRIQSLKTNPKITPLMNEMSKSQKQIINQQNKNLHFDSFNKLSQIDRFQLRRQLSPKKGSIERTSPRRESIDRNRKDKSKSKSPMETIKRSIQTKNNDSYEEYSKQIYLEEEEKGDDIGFYSTQEMQQLIEQVHSNEKQLENEKVKNIKLLQQLSISEAKLKQITEDKMHIQTHKSIGIVCQDYHTTYTRLVIIGLGFFVMGFFLGKIQSQYV